MIEALAWAAFIEAGVRLAIPLVLAALGEMVSERAGVLNIGLEGSIIAGALGAALGAMATGSAAAGIVIGALAGLLIGLAFAVPVVWLNTDQIITGTAVTLLGLGGTAAIYSSRFGVTGTQLTLPTLDPIRIPLLADIPVIGQAFFNLAPTAYLTFALAPALAWFLFRTEWGLEIRAVGEDPAAASAAGLPVKQLRFGAALFGTLLAGLAGAHLALAYAGTFAENMSAGRGFIAIAVVVLGRWRPWSVLVAGLFFGAASGLQFLLQTLGWDIGYQLFLALPYILTLAALGGLFGRARAPAALGQPWPPTQ